VVLVTGGGGSIGSELCRQAAKCRPKRIVIFDIYENNAYELLNELKQTYGELIDVCIRIGSVCDSKRLEQIFCEFTPSVIFHAAAHKHVPLLQDSPCEAIKNNVFGTLNTAKAAGKYGAKRFVLLSTDKAVNPTSIMGASKRITEMIIQAVNWHNQTIYTAVRFGNVLGSSGSVVPLFQKQIENGGPVTVTHPDMTRYFMTIPEAAQLVVQAGGLATGGELFVLDMGEPVKILDLAYNLIKLSGLEPDTDIKIRFTGLRPGEKLYEELSYQDEEINRQSTQHSKIFIVPPVAFDTRVFRTQLDNLKEYAEIGDVPALYAELNEVIYGCLKNEAKEHRLLTYGKGNEISDSCKTTLSQDSAGTMTHVSA
jgi:FlaA1/EpsC-like NDP-sugar epimerase